MTGSDYKVQIVATDTTFTDINDELILSFLEASSEINLDSTKQTDYLDQTCNTIVIHLDDYFEYYHKDTLLYDIQEYSNVIVENMSNIYIQTNYSGENYSISVRAYDEVFNKENTSLIFNITEQSPPVIERVDVTSNLESSMYLVLPQDYNTIEMM